MLFGTCQERERSGNFGDFWVNYLLGEGFILTTCLGRRLWILVTSYDNSSVGPFAKPALQVGDNKEERLERTQRSRESSRAHSWQ